MVDYEDHEEVMILEGKQDGDIFKKVARSTRTEDGETVEYVSMKQGQLEQTELRSGQAGLAERVTDSTSLGSPDYIGDLAVALLKLNEKVNDEPIDEVVGHLIE